MNFLIHRFQVLVSQQSAPASLFVDLHGSNAEQIHENLQGEFILVPQLNQSTREHYQDNTWCKWNQEIRKKFYIFKRNQGKL